MTVARLLEELSNDEYVKWQVFYGRRAQKAELAAGKNRVTGKGK